MGIARKPYTPLQLRLKSAIDAIGVLVQKNLRVRAISLTRQRVLILLHPSPRCASLGGEVVAWHPGPAGRIETWETVVEGVDVRWQQQSRTCIH